MSEDVINKGDKGEEETEGENEVIEKANARLLTDTLIASRAASNNETYLNIGENQMSYIGAKEGDNIIRLYMSNEWGYEVSKDIELLVNLPQWELTNSMGEEVVDIPYKDKFSFNLSVDEADIFNQSL